jgi:hypothetical protein
MLGRLLFPAFVFDVMNFDSDQVPGFAKLEERTGLLAGDKKFDCRKPDLGSFSDRQALTHAGNDNRAGGIGRNILELRVLRQK